MFGKKKKKPTWAVQLGVDVKRCSECGKHQRPCLIKGKPATFLCWVVQERGLLKIDVFARPEEQERLYKHFKEDGIVPPGCSVEKLRETLALVEWPDGSVSTEPVLHVHFLDREG